MTKIIVRKANPNEVTDLIRLIRLGDAEEKGEYRPDGVPIERAIAQTMLHWADFFVALDGRKVIGQNRLSLVDVRYYDDNNELQIEPGWLTGDPFVMEKWRNKRVFTKIRDTLEKYAEDAGIKKLYSDDHPTGYGIDELLLKRGFEKIGRCGMCPLSETKKKDEEPKCKAKMYVKEF